MPPTTFVIMSSDIGRCPKRSMLPMHYRPDGSCRCFSPTTRTPVSKAVTDAVFAYAQLKRTRRSVRDQERALRKRLDNMSRSERAAYHEIRDEAAADGDPKAKRQTYV